ncbi:hypothetical protein [Algoriphagus boritolerans]|uniref:hypothetical protein n=1 Tax=Algoriphagus boritolerans TaxID=308111 RepID=UPI000A53A24F
MKLERILDKLSSIEKNSFIKIIDNIISKSKAKSKEIEKILAPDNKGLKTVDNLNISKIFDLTADEFTEYLKCEFQEVNSQLDILIDIIIRDGNCIMRQDWFSRLYEAEIKVLNAKIKALSAEFKDEKSELSAERKRDYRIYQPVSPQHFSTTWPITGKPKLPPTNSALLSHFPENLAFLRKKSNSSITLS